MESRNDRATTPLLFSDDEETQYSVYDDDDLSAAAKLRARKRRINQCMKLMCAVLVIVVIGVLTFVLSYGLKKSGSGGNAKPGVYLHSAVASDVTLCSQIGRDILEKKGGNAVDAALAALLCMGLADPQSMGIGGGFFMTIYNRTTGSSYTVDAREMAPLKATYDMYYGNPSASNVGGLAIAVPGELKGYEMAYQKHGTPGLWGDIFQPAIDMAEQGFPVPGSLDQALKDYLNSHNASVREKNVEFEKTFVNPETKAYYTKGEILKYKKLAKTLKVLQAEYSAAFYNGTLTQDILADMKDFGSIITGEDLASYASLYTEALPASLSNNYTIFGPYAPSSGAVLMFMLKVLDGYHLNPDSIATTDAKILTYHRITETFKFAYAKRTLLADPNFDDKVDELIKNLTSTDYADFIRAQIWDNQTHPYMYYGPSYGQPNKTSTAHLSVIDAAGNAVSVTSTVNLRFGSEVIGSRTGIIFNDEMDDFATSNLPNQFGVYPSPANNIVPHKRPLSSMCPVVLVDSKGNVQMVVGAAGGTRITTATAFVAAHVLWLGLDIQQAVDMPRLHNQLLPWETELETGFDKAVGEGLKMRMKHNITEVAPGKSVVQGIMRQRDGSLYARSDPRKGGSPAGY